MPVINLKVIHADGSEVAVCAGPREQVAFERQHKKGLGAALSGDGMFVSDMYWLAWKAEFNVNQATGVTTQLFDQWIESITDVELGSDDPL